MNKGLGKYITGRFSTRLEHLIPNAFKLVSKNEAGANYVVYELLGVQSRHAPQLRCFIWFRVQFDGIKVYCSFDFDGVCYFAAPSFLPVDMSEKIKRDIIGRNGGFPLTSLWAERISKGWQFDGLPQADLELIIDEIIEKIKTYAVPYFTMLSEIGPEV